VATTWKLAPERESALPKKENDRTFLGRRMTHFARTMDGLLQLGVSIKMNDLILV
jgi:hypothetical protein